MTEMRVYLNRAMGFAAVAAFALGTAAFGQCDVVCPDGASQESEPCGQDTNGGCNMTSPQFEPLAIEQTYCGTAYADGETRDTDWYEVEITNVPVTLYWSGKAEFSFVVGLVEYAEGTEGSGNCDDNTGYISPYASGDACTGASIEVEITVAGTYWFFVAPFGEVVECDGSPDYVVSLTTTEANGACCLPDDTCIDGVTFDECINSPNNGQFMGPLTVCEEVDCVGRPCPTYPGAIVLSDSLDQFTVEPGTGIACAGPGDPQYTTDNWYARSYDLEQIPEIAGEDFFYITCVEVGVESNNGSDVQAHCNIYRDTNGGSPTKANVDLLLLASKDFVIPSGTSAEIFALNFGDAVAFDMNDPNFPVNYLVIEMFIEASLETESGVWPGCNNNGEVGPTYFMTPDCGLPTYVTMASIGFPDCHWVNSVVGATSEPGRNIWLDGEAWPPFDAPGNVQPVTDPTGDWMELYPTFSPTWTCTGWDDSNEDGVVSECDFMTMVTGGEEETNWHVEWIGLTVWLKLVGGEDLYYIEFRGDLENPDFPLGLYHEVYPMFCTDWLVVDFLDSVGNNDVPDPGDYYFVDEDGEQVFYEVVGVATDIELLEATAEEPCPWDFDGDGDVDTADLLFLLGAWGTPNGDTDGDGDTDTADLLGLLGNWGDCP